MNSMQSLSRLFVATCFIIGSAGAASAQTIGSNLAQFNVLGNNQITLTGPNPVQPLVVNVAGTSPGITLTLTNAQANTFHANDIVAQNGQAEGLQLWNDLLAPAGANPTIVLAAATMPPNIPAIGALLAGPTLITAAANMSNTNSATTITGVPGSIVIFQVATSMTMTDHDVTLAGGILPANVFYRVVQAATVINNDAQTRSFPGTIVNNTGAQDIAITVSGAGSLNIGRFASLQGNVTVTQSGPGILSFTIPAGADTVGDSISCSPGYFYPSPATGRTGTFAYCMASPGRVRINVYNVIGDLASKIEDQKQAGNQLSTMDTSRLAPGVYLYIVERDYGNGNIVRSGVKKFVVKH